MIRHLPKSVLRFGRFAIVILFAGQSLFAQKGQQAPSDQVFIDTIRVDSAAVEEPKHFQDLEEPKVQITIKGYVRLNATYDFTGIRNTEGFNPYEIPIDENLNEQLKGFYIGARQSRLGFETILNTRLGALRTYIEGDFAGDNSGVAFRLRHAFGRFKSWTLGQTWSTFTDLEAIPFTVDFDGPNSSATVRQGLIRFEKVLNPNLDMAISAENPTKNFFNPYDTADVDLQRDVDLVARIRKKMPWGHIQLAGVLRSLTYLDNTGEFAGQTGGGVMVSGVIRTGKKFRILFQLKGGKGIARYISGLSGKDEDGYVVPDGPLKLLLVYAGYTALEYTLNEKVAVTGIVGHTRIFNLPEQPGESFQSSRYGALNLSYSIMSNFGLGFETAFGNRKNKDGQSNNGVRLQFMARFNF